MRLKRFFNSHRGWYNYPALIILTVVLLIFYIIQMTYLNSFINTKYGRRQDFENRLPNGEFSFFPNFKFEGERLVHFDLKGAPPKVSFVVEFIPFIKKLGATGILLEYEDMFPYDGELKDISAENAYSLSDIEKIVKTAQMFNLTIIPLIPTFSHFEFVLKLEKFRQFREVDEYPHVLCPIQNKIYPILQKMIDQVLAAHPTANYLHIGCDEAFIVGRCNKCRDLMKRNKWQTEDIYFYHVRKIAQYIITTYPEVRPIIWGDKFLKRYEGVILSHRIPDFVDVMLWNYHSEKSTFPQDEDMNCLARLFKNIWIASAFKGATGSTKIVTDSRYYFRNTKAWMHFVEQWKKKIKFKGIALTGWQRYSHFSVLCELLPVGVPSLALSLQYLNKKKGSDHDKVKHDLNCNESVPMNEEVSDSGEISGIKCDFPGHGIYKIIHSFYNAALEIKKLLKDFESGNLSFYSVTHNTSDPIYVHEISLKSYKKHLMKLMKLEADLRSTLSEVYDRYTIKEWILTHSMPLRLRLEAAIKILSQLKSRKVWPKRPFADITPQVGRIFNKTCIETETLGCALLNVF